MTTTPTPQPDHLSAEAAFGTRLDDMVRHHIGNLTSSHAVDEANGDVLDALIDSAVEEQQEAIDARAIRRREALRRQLSGIKSDLASASGTEDESLGRVRTLASRVLSFRTRVSGPDGADGADAPEDYSVFEVQRLRDFAAQRRTVLEQDSRESLKAARTRSSSRLLVKRDAAVRHSEANGRRLQTGVERHDAAVGEFDIALAKFRGQPTEQPGSSIPAVAPEATHDAP